MERGPLPIARLRPGHPAGGLAARCCRRGGRHAAADVDECGKPAAGRRLPRRKPRGRVATCGVSVNSGSGCGGCAHLRHGRSPGSGAADHELPGRQQGVRHDLPDRGHEPDGHRSTGAGHHQGTPGALRGRQPHHASLRSRPRWPGIANHRAVCRRSFLGGLYPQGADGCRRHPEGRHRPESHSVLATPVRELQPGRARRGCQRGLHQDAAMGRRHRRLDADLPGRPNRPTDRQQGRRQRGERFGGAHAPRRI